MVKQFEARRKQAEKIFARQDGLCRLKEMQQLAQIHGGVCLSKCYVDHEAKLRFRCAENHEWEAVPSSVRRGTWCGICGSKRVGRSKALTIEKMHEIAAKHGGECHSQVYKNNATKLRWRCKDGHEWEAVPASILIGRWCAICAGKLPKPQALQELQKIAAKRGGLLLSKRYQNSHSRLLWQCGKGHKWKAVPSAVNDNPVKVEQLGVWKRKYLEEMQNIAKARGGKLLSKFYINNQTKLQWRCKEGHIWEAVPGSVKGGSWCRLCSFKIIAAKKLKHTIEELRTLAKAKGGDCLSRSYTGIDFKHHWRCEKRHEWRATPRHLMRGQWCPFCAGKR